MEMYDIREKRFDPPLMDTLEYLLDTLKLKPPEDEEFWGEWIEENI